MDTNSKKYKTILADPPWKTNQTGRNSNRSAEHHYDLMSLEHIKAMPVADLCEDNSHLYLWCPNGLIPEALEVINAWGFIFRSPIYWIKPRLGLGLVSAWVFISVTPARLVSLPLVARLR